MGRVPAAGNQAAIGRTWLKGLDLAPKSKGHLKNQMRMVFNCAMRWELVPYQTNPIGLVRVKDVSKRVRQPTTLTIGQFRRVLEHIPEPYRTSASWQGALGCESVRFLDCSGATSTGKNTSCRYAVPGFAIALTSPDGEIGDDRYRGSRTRESAVGTPRSSASILPRV